MVFGSCLRGSELCKLPRNKFAYGGFLYISYHKLSMWRNRCKCCCLLCFLCLLVLYDFRINQKLYLEIHQQSQ